MAEEHGFRSASEILAQKLTQARKSRGITLEEVSKLLNISKEHLEKIEAGDFTFLPVVYVYAFLKEYAAALDLAGDPLLEQCRDELSIPTEDQVLRQVPERGERLSTLPEKPGWASYLETITDSVPLPVLAGSGLAVAVIILLVVGMLVMKAFESPGQEDTSGEAGNRTSEVEIVEEPVRPDTLAVDTAAVTSPPSVSSEPWASDVSFLPESPDSPYSKVLVIRIINDMTWVKVVADDGEIVFPGGRFTKGEVLRYEARNSFWVNVGRPSFVEMYLNGEKVPPLSERTAILGK
ncbi:helix-turn-helix domain-containing protein [Prosthecochloris sp. HL-130-GSB]|jgi:cytoskeleton protein RodZ|uniref:Helix-turn-helix domain-containing protein n=1 Tax=Prosthecochloris aestuarii TaxID=1102 RepID=A0A831SSX3_PROAE|nr:helix-turn-helix domain-containing protein [Prosthecochloris sp. HL-130-GSB]ARM31567.1 hypothetical protein B9H02_09990 [Prosthecochloris sp. HL-130-GSB]HED31533.1 helix-turn-helix domain-containing protein [Prosthecochloris aestuarii]